MPYDLEADIGLTPYSREAATTNALRLQAALDAACPRGDFAAELVARGLTGGWSGPVLKTIEAAGKDFYFDRTIYGTVRDGGLTIVGAGGGVVAGLRTGGLSISPGPAEQIGAVTRFVWTKTPTTALLAIDPSRQFSWLFRGTGGGLSGVQCYGTVTPGNIWSDDWLVAWSSTDGGTKIQFSTSPSFSWTHNFAVGDVIRVYAADAPATDPGLKSEVAGPFTVTDVTATTLKIAAVSTTGWATPNVYIRKNRFPVCIGIEGRSDPPTGKMAFRDLAPHNYDLAVLCLPGYYPSRTAALTSGLSGNSVTLTATTAHRVADGTVTLLWDSGASLGSCVGTVDATSGVAAMSFVRASGDSLPANGTAVTILGAASAARVDVGSGSMGEHADETSWHDLRCGRVGGIFRSDNIQCLGHTFYGETAGIVDVDGSYFHFNRGGLASVFGSVLVYPRACKVLRCNHLSQNTYVFRLDRVDVDGDPVDGAKGKYLLYWDDQAGDATGFAPVVEIVANVADDDASAYDPEKLVYLGADGNRVSSRNIRLTVNNRQSTPPDGMVWVTSSGGQSFLREFSATAETVQTPLAGIVAAAQAAGSGGSQSGGAATSLNNQGGDVTTELGPIQISTPGQRVNCVQGVTLAAGDSIVAGSIVAGASPAGLSVSATSVSTDDLTIAGVEYPAGSVIYYTLTAVDGMTATTGSVTFDFETESGEQLGITKDVAISRRIRSR